MLSHAAWGKASLICTDCAKKTYFCFKILLGPSHGTFKSPINIRSNQKLQVGSSIRTPDSIIESAQKQQLSQQLIVRPGASKENVTRQYSRIPASKVIYSSAEIHPGSKVQHGQVITTQTVTSIYLDSVPFTDSSMSTVEVFMLANHAVLGLNLGTLDRHFLIKDFSSAA